MFPAVNGHLRSALNETDYHLTSQEVISLHLMTEIVFSVLVDWLLFSSTAGIEGGFALACLSPKAVRDPEAVLREEAGDSRREEACSGFSCLPEVSLIAFSVSFT